MRHSSARRLFGLSAAAALLVSGSAASVAVAATEPPLVPAPAAKCGQGSRPETGIQGRVSRADHESGRAAKGFTCNTKLVGSYSRPTSYGTVGGFKVERYVDAAGNECAYYDTTLLFPTNIMDGQAGVNVLDMSDPRKPKLADRLLSPAMLSPHESLVVNQKRGLLVAVLGNPGTAPGIVDIYDISKDCRKPVLKSSSPVGVLGHESGMSPDGRTFYAGSAGGNTLVAVDISNPSLPRTLWMGKYASHGLSVSPDGKRVYVAGVGGGRLEPSGLIILDTSEVQARKPVPAVREVSRLTWKSISIPQNAIPVTIGGKPYVVEVDEYGSQDAVGAARIIDVSNERAPRVVSNLRLAVHQPKNFAAQANDPGEGNYVGGYSAHYCNVPKRVDPGIVACSMNLSGLRVFDVRDPMRPREIAYFNSPLSMNSVFPGPSNWAQSSPSFAPERGEIWYTDGLTGFHAVRLTNGVWPFRTAGSAGEGATGGDSTSRPGTTSRTAGSTGSDGPDSAIGDGASESGTDADGASPGADDGDGSLPLTGAPLAAIGALGAVMIGLGLALRARRGKARSSN